MIIVISNPIIMKISSVGAGDAAASSSNDFWAKLIRFGQIWTKFGQNLVKLEAKFGQK